MSRALIAMNPLGKPVIIATDCSAMRFDMEDVGSCDADDLSLGRPSDFDEPGFYLWEGEFKEYRRGLEEVPEIEYVGTVRRLTRADNVWALCAMRDDFMPDLSECRDSSE